MNHRPFGESALLTNFSIFLLNIVKGRWKIKSVSFGHQHTENGIDEKASAAVLNAIIWPFRVIRIIIYQHFLTITIFYSNSKQLKCQRLFNIITFITNNRIYRRITSIPIPFSLCSNMNIIYSVKWATAD